MGVGAGLSMYVVVVQKFTFAISSPDEFLVLVLLAFVVLGLVSSDYVMRLAEKNVSEMTCFVSSVM